MLSATGPQLSPSKKGSGERKTAAGGRFKKMGLTCVERQPYGFALVDLGPLAKKRDDLGRAGMRDDMRFRTCRLDKGNGAGQSIDWVETDVLGTNPEDHIASRESPSSLADRHGRAARQGEPRAIPAFDRSFKQIHRWRSEEGRDERVGGPVVELERGAHLLDAAAVHHHNLIAHRHGFDLVVGHINRGCFEPVLERLDLAAHLYAKLGVEVRQGFVEQENFGIADDRPTHRNPLPLAARKLPRIASEQWL